MDRRNFLKSFLIIPSFPYSLFLSDVDKSYFQIFIISSFPQRILPFLLKRVKELEMIKEKHFSFSGNHPNRNKLIKALLSDGWKNSVSNLGIKISFHILKESVAPSFTLLRDGRIFDLRRRGFFSLWEKMNEMESSTSWITIVSKEKRQIAYPGKIVSFFIEGKEVEQIPLSAKYKKAFSCREGKVVVSIKDRQVWVEKSSCRNKICLKTPPAFLEGERIICAPNGFLLEVKGNFHIDTSIG
ncbi:MAG: NusG domain II-containing protein [Candidatus Aminicenantia bacterium]